MVSNMFACREVDGSFLAESAEFLDLFTFVLGEFGKVVDIAFIIIVLEDDAIEEIAVGEIVVEEFCNRWFDTSKSAYAQFISSKIGSNEFARFTQFFADSVQNKTINWKTRNCILVIWNK